METNVMVKIIIKSLKPFFDDEGVRIPDERAMQLVSDGIRKCIVEYVEEGLESDFLNSEYSLEDADSYLNFGEIDVKIK